MANGGQGARTKLIVMNKIVILLHFLPFDDAIISRAWTRNKISVFDLFGHYYGVHNNQELRRCHVPIHTQVTP